MTETPSSTRRPAAGLAFTRWAVPSLTVHDARAVTRHDQRDLHERVQDVAHRMADAGIVPRTLLALALPDPVDQIVGFLGAISAGAVPCLLPAPGTTDELEQWERRGLVMSGVDLDGATVSGRGRFVDDDALYVQRTSGTGREAAAIVISGRAAAVSVEACARRLFDTRPSVTTGWLPLHHDYGLMCQVLLPMAVGGSTVLLPAADWLGEPGLLFAAVEEHGGTHTYMPAFGFRRCVDRVAPDATYDLSSWRNVNCAGEPVPPGVLPAFEERCRPWGLRPGAVSVAYGMAEVVAGATIAPLGGGYAVDTVSASTLLADGRATPSHRGRRFVSCGPPIDCLEGAVVDHDGRPLAERDVGEIALRGPTLGAVLTDDGTRPLPTTSDGWFRTGDIGYLADGEVHVVDRARDLIIVGGVNLHPSRIEQAALDAVPAVRRSAAFGVMDLTTGTEQPVLLLERPRDPLDESAALRKVRRALLGIGVAVRDVAFVDRGTIAMTTSGKVRRRATRESYLAAAPTASAAGPRDWLEVVRDVTGVEAVHVDTTLDDLRVDSLALLELVTALETLLDVEVDLDELRPVATLGDLGRVLGIGREPPSGRSLDGPRTPVASSPPCNRLRRRIRLGPVLGPVHLPLRLGIQAHVFAASLRLRFGGGASALVPVVELAEAVGADVDDVARISLLTNTWTAWRQAAAPAELRRVMTRPTDRRKAPLRVVGGDHLTEAVAVGRGVILLALHQSVAPILQAFPALDGLSFRPFDARATTSVERAWQLREAHETLRRGGVVMILADEFIGTGGITVEIAGKDRPLRPGFARLAVATEAEVVPAFGSYDTAGRLTIDLRAPMSGATEDELLADYGSMLRTFWHEHPGSLTWNIVRRHRTFDRAPSGGALQEVGP